MHLLVDGTSNIEAHPESSAYFLGAIALVVHITFRSAFADATADAYVAVAIDKTLGEKARCLDVSWWMATAARRGREHRGGCCDECDCVGVRVV